MLTGFAVAAAARAALRPCCVLAAFAVCAALTLAACASGETSEDSSAASAEPHDGTSPPGGSTRSPWPVPADVAERVAAAGLVLGPMGMAEHYHPHVSIVVDGTSLPVAANIGVDPTTGAMSALHTHDSSGTIHIEAATKGQVFTLGQLFTEWGVVLTRNQIGGVHAGDGEHVRVTSNGSEVTGDPMKLQLEAGQQIQLTLG
jgi:hypothetical protein